MNVKKLVGMAVVLVLLIGVAIWQHQGEKTRTRAVMADDATLLQGVDLNAITQLDITQASNHVALIKKDKRWVVDSLYDYPANFTKLADALRTMADVKTGNPIHTGNVDASEFGLDENAKTIALKDVVSVTLGARREASSSVGWANQFFVQKSDNGNVYLVDYDFRPFSERSADWINKELLRVPSADIISVQSGDVELKQDETEWILTDLNKETEELQSSEANQLRSALQSLSCVTIADPNADFVESQTYTARTKDGVTYTVKLGAKTDDGLLVRIAAEYTRPAPPIESEGDDAAKKEAYSKQLDAFNNTAATTADNVDKLNAKLSKWTYIISHSAAESLTIPRNTLVKPKTEETS